MRKWFAIGTALCALTSSVVGVAQQTPTFRSGVALATIDVTIVDKDGKPVPGLTADDLEIKLGGKVQPIRALAFVQVAPTSAPVDKAAAPPASAPPASANPATVAPTAPPVGASSTADEARRTIDNMNAPRSASASAERNVVTAPEQGGATAVPPAESRVFVLLVDDLSFAPQRGRAMFAAASRFIDRLPPSDIVGFATTSGLGAVNPTRDRAPLRAALAKVVGAFNDPRGIGSRDSTGNKLGPQTDQPLGINESIDIEQGNDTLLKSVIARECYNGDINALGGQSVQQILIENTCAKSVQIEARRVAALTRQNKARQIEGITSVINAMKGAAGLRHLVVLTEGLAISRDIIDLNPMQRAAAQAGIQLSVLLEDPDVSMNDTGRQSLGAGERAQTDTGTSSRRREDNRLLLSGAQTVNDMLGGTFYRVIGSADAPFDKVILASSAVYRLGVELPSGATQGKEYSVSVSVKRAGLTARTNRIVIAGESDTRKPAAKGAASDPTNDPSKYLTGAVPASADDVMKAALNARTVVGDVPIRMAVAKRRSSTAQGQVDVSVNIAMPASVKGPVTTFVGIIDASGNIRNSRRVLEATANADYAASYLFPLAPGDYRIRFVASDATGALGTIEAPLSATLAPLGPFTAGDVLTFVVDSTNRAQLFTIEDVPMGATSLNAALEIYPTGAMPGESPDVRWTLARDGEATTIATQTVAAQPDASLMRADVVFPFAALAPGLYTVRAELLINDKPVGSRAVVVRKR